MVEETLQLAKKADKVTALDTDRNSPTAHAERLLNREAAAIASEHWNFNYRYDVELTPNADDKIELPEGTIWIDSYGSDSNRNVFALGGSEADETRFLFDGDENTDEFTSSIRVEYRILYELDCQPVWIQKLLCAMAAKAMTDQRREPELYLTLEAEVTNRRRHAKMVDERQRDANVLKTYRNRYLSGNRHRPWGTW